MQKAKIAYTIKHRKAFRRVEKKLLGHNTLRGILHDLDKVFLYMIFDYKSVHNWHRNHSRHHSVKAKTHKTIGGICNTYCRRLCSVYDLFSA